MPPQARAARHRQEPSVLPRTDASPYPPLGENFGILDDESAPLGHTPEDVGAAGGLRPPAGFDIHVGFASR